MNPWEALGPNPYIYCERQLGGWIAEPANTWSNAGYLLAALLIFFHSQYESKRTRNLFAVATLALFLGSTFFHVSGSYWGHMADTGSMFFLSVVILTLAIERRFPQVGELWANCFLVSLLAASLTWLLWHGSGGSLFSLELFAAAGLELKMKKFRPKLLLSSLGVLGLAFVVRLLDVKKIACDPENHWINGHALWHLLAALSIWLYYLSFQRGKNKDYYFENGLMVFTREYHLKRGTCCNSGCRHCPYR